jgi:hypothetical protein
MDGEAYARELLAILTNPDPTGIDPADPYGQADDGIDRYDGFGRDVWVESITVVPGEHGAELAVEWAAGRRLRGIANLPFDTEWRQLSGYAEPGAYAPRVAKEVWFAAATEYERRQGDLDKAKLRASLPDRPTQWHLLLDALAVEGEPREV